jgi:hypothetical protein
MDVVSARSAFHSQTERDEMKLHPKRILAGTSALAIAGGVLLATSGAAFAVTPGWEPDANSIGAITFTDATGAPITTGSVTAPMGAFVIGQHVGRAGDTKATLIGSTPKAGVDSQLWSTEQLSSSTIYSPTPAGIPADLGSTGLPVVTSSAGDETLAQYIDDFPNTSAVAGFQNLYEIRLYTSGTSASGATFDSADVQVSGITTDAGGNVTGGTWTVVYPPITDVTTTTITETPPSPDIVTGTPQSVTLNASTSAATAVPASYTGPIGAVQFFDGATQVGPTTLVTGTGPYTASFVDSVTNPSTHSFKAVFSAFDGSTLITSSSAPSAWTVSPPLPTATTTLSATWQAFAGGASPTHFSGTVTGNGTTPPPVTGGTVNLFDNGSTTPLNASPLTVGAGGAYSADIIIATAGPHSVVATFTDAGVYLPSNSTPVTQTLGSNPNGLCSTNPATGHTPTDLCSDVQTITGTVPVGTLTVSTPYTAANPFNVGNLALDSTGTILTAHAQFGGAGLDPTNANADIIVTDTRGGDLNWTLQAQSSNLQDTTSDIINSQNVGLTGLGSHPAPGFNSAGLVGFDNPAANGVAPAAAGNAGLGGAIKHDVAQATGGIGTVGIYGTLTLNAPTSTPAGTYTGTVTFTIVGALV